MGNTSIDARLTDKIHKISVDLLQEKGIDDLVKISTLGDGSCYFHSFLRATKMGYIRGTEQERKEIVNEFRHTLANLLLKKNDKGVTNYEKLGDGKLKEFSGEGVYEYSLNTLINDLINNRTTDGIYQSLISDNTNFDVYILYLTKVKGNRYFNEIFGDLPNDISYVELNEYINPHFNNYDIPSNNYDTLGHYNYSDKFKIYPSVPHEKLSSIYKRRNSVILLFHADLQHYECVGKIKYVLHDGKYVGLINTIFSHEDPIIQTLYKHIMKIR